MAKIACLDVGLKRIGVAFCFQKDIVIPFDAIMRKNRKQASNDVSKVLEEWGIELLVVGLPMGGSSSEEMQRRIRHFVSLLDFSGDIEYVDEYGSSMEAKAVSQGIVKQKKDGKIDSIAAKLILQRYLEQTNSKCYM